jgi:hypothetical protein
VKAAFDVLTVNGQRTTEAMGEVYGHNRDCRRGAIQVEVELVCDMKHS